MARGGRREGAGRKPKLPEDPNRPRISKEPLPEGTILGPLKRGPKKGQIKAQNKKFARGVIEARIRELLKRNTEPAKVEAARLAIAIMPFEEPRLAAAVVKSEVSVNYVAELPSPIKDITEWQKTLQLLDKK